jgi:hypothetical protein
LTVPAPARPPAPLGRAAPPAALTRRLAARLGTEWLPRASWTVSRTGRPGLLGLALLIGTALFFLSTHLPVASEVAALRADLAAQPLSHPPVAPLVADPSGAAPALPTRADVPAILLQLFNKATQARLAVDAGRYEVNATRSSGVVRYQISFPVTGPYPQIRSFLDSTLATMPALALTDLVLERKSIADGNVEAQIRMTVYAAAPGAGARPGAGSATAAPGRQEPPNAAATGDAEASPRGAAPRAGEARPAAERVVAPTHAAALFAQHSWFVLPPAPPPAPPPPPPAPTAPPFPYAFLGSYAPDGEPPVFFLARGDRVIDARVGDRLDGVYQFESAAGGQLVFVYLPLNVRHHLAGGVSK